MVSSIPDPPLGCKASFPGASSLSPGSWGGGSVVRVMKALWWGRCRCWCHFLFCPRCSAGVRWLLWKLVLPRGDLSSAQVTPAALKHCPQLPKCETRLSLPLFSAMFSSSTLERAAHFVTPLEQGRDISGSPPSAHGATFSCGPKGGGLPGALGAPAWLRCLPSPPDTHKTTRREQRQLSPPSVLTLPQTNCSGGGLNRLPSF